MRAGEVLWDFVFHGVVLCTIIGWEVPSSWMLDVDRLAICRPAWSTRWVWLSTVEHSFIEAVLALLCGSQNLTIQSMITDPELIMTHVMCAYTYAELNYLPRPIRALHGSGNEIR